MRNTIISSILCLLAAPPFLYAGEVWYGINPDFIGAVASSKIGRVSLAGDILPAIDLPYQAATSLAVVPEPTTLLLLGLGVAMVAKRR